MGLFDFLGDVSTVASPGLEAYGKGRLAEASTVATLRNQLIDDLVRRAKFAFDIEKQGSLETYRGKRLEQGERGLQVKEAAPGLKVEQFNKLLEELMPGPFTRTERIRRITEDPKVGVTLTPGGGSITFNKRDEDEIERLITALIVGWDMVMGGGGTATAEERIPPGGGGGFLGGPPPAPAPGIYQRGVNLIGSEAIPGPTVRDVVSGIKSLYGKEVEIPVKVAEFIGKIPLLRRAVRTEIVGGRSGLTPGALLQELRKRGAPKEKIEAAFYEDFGKFMSRESEPTR